MTNNDRGPSRAAAHPFTLAWLPACLLLGAGCSCQPEAGALLQQQGGHQAAQTKVEGEFWYVNYILGAKVGYEQTAVRRDTADGRPVLRIDGASHTSVRRDGQQIQLDMTYRSTETLDGKLLDFELQFNQGPTPMKSRGKSQGDTLVIETTTQGKTVTSTIPAPGGCGGFYATQQSLLNAPMKPGDKRSISALIPGFNLVGTTELDARAYEPVSFPTGTRELLRIDAATTAPGGLSLQGTMWTDRTGQIHKHRIEAMNMESLLSTKAEALEQASPAELDLVAGVGVPVDKPLASPHATKRVTYLVRLERGDPAAAFVVGPTQQVEALDAHTARVTVWAVRPGGPPGNPRAPADLPTDDDLRPNNWIQSDNPKIVAMAREAAGSEGDPWATAVALERYVHQKITEKNYSQAFASAAEVADTLEGDCTEHAVFLAALARARGIPARVAMGLVYKGQKFYYHMWTELYVKNRWIPMDGTLGQGGIGAAHLKLGESNMKGVSPFTSFLPLLKVIGQLNIEIEDVE